MLWRLDDPTNPGGVIRVGVTDQSGSTAAGITSVRPSGPCMIRLARGTTEIEEVSFYGGRVLFDTTFSDAPPAGTHTYNLQVRTEQQGGCTAYLGGGLVPMPSLYVQSFYDWAIP